MWRYAVDGVEIEKRVLMPHGQNTVHVTYRLLRGEGPVRLTLRPSVHFRPYEAPVDAASSMAYTLTASTEGYELAAADERFPPLRMLGTGLAPR